MLMLDLGRRQPKANWGLPSCTSSFLSSKLACNPPGGEGRPIPSAAGGSSAPPNSSGGSGALHTNTPRPTRRPKDPAVLKILRVVNVLRVVNLLPHGDLLSLCTLCRNHFPWFYRHFASRRRVHDIVNMGGVVKTLQRRSSLVVLSS